MGNKKRNLAVRPKQCRRLHRRRNYFQCILTPDHDEAKDNNNHNSGGGSDSSSSVVVCSNILDYGCRFTQILNAFSMNGGVNQHLDKST
ncbi:hypothetical protein F8388_000169 [Cannabis sativa]|uniref:Uncharacterized protein n=1 Tax=Cannabis sativa TaxID=3483 RepID=A0A7J6F0H4_CANSA|nr:hypothetical protein F8388_000169 [Cannabis sativa]